MTAFGQYAVRSSDGPSAASQPHLIVAR